ncbi:MAG: helix-turn-helix domain-containing protein [Oscillospiraceae bacterium]|nr:helix-turn-helix domain-containing protein [Oscillospiraceae bacterium]
MSLGEMLRNLLDEWDITQKELASNINIGASTLGNYMQDIREPDYEVLKILASYFNVSTDYLLEHKTNQITSINEDELIRIFRNLSVDQQELFIQQGKLLINYNKKINGL